MKTNTRRFSCTAETTTRVRITNKKFYQYCELKETWRHNVPWGEIQNLAREDNVPRVYIVVLQALTREWTS